MTRALTIADLALDPDRVLVDIGQGRVVTLRRLLEEFDGAQPPTQETPTP